MTSRPPRRSAKRTVPLSLRHAAKSAGQALYYAPGSRRLPPSGYRLENYKSWFPKTGQVFLRYLKGSELLAVEAVNHSKDYMAARKLIAERALLNPQKLEQSEVALKEAI